MLVMLGFYCIMEWMTKDLEMVQPFSWIPVIWWILNIGKDSSAVHLLSYPSLCFHVTMMLHTR